MVKNGEDCHGLQTMNLYRLHVISQISESQPISHPSVNFADLGSGLSIEICSIS